MGGTTPPPPLTCKPVSKYLPVNHYYGGKLYQNTRQENTEYKKKSKLGHQNSFQNIRVGKSEIQAKNSFRQKEFDD